ncbi:penicillin acylase family protein [Merismopedia glauca]|uniref:Penicillin acylase family protein n=1 Tax=Merismopedia glauca CCAP 1448/3 TaxID=1296344 RepID=A0A2T1C193_9CYAN|nr:penicillin acylase family protein [Merismopedia glauca]PSB02012.1 penicillin acylase family protein [Merismopedia glauca CCAP 1448/3]
MRKLLKFFGGKFLRLFVVFLAIATLCIGTFSIYTVRQSFPQESGMIALKGLQSEVKIERDRFGIPQIYASSTHDLAMAQGFIHAQDRFWQMDFWRHIGSGRLSEIFGKSQLETDRYLRTMGWARVAKLELQQLSPATQSNLQAYADGVNAYLVTHQGSAISLEYAVLKFTNPNYQPEPWQPIHSLTWGKVMAYDLGRNLEREIERTVLLQTLPLDKVESLFPAYPDNLPIILPNYTKKQAETLYSPTPDLVQAVAPTLATLSSPLTAIADLLGSTSDGIGSNSWVISGKRTATGKPILANDPHLGVQMPSIWYEIGLHCLSKTPKCPYNVAGFAFPGVPGVVIGHNDRIAWGVTNIGADVMDLYIEKINPANPNQYEVNGKWVDMQVIAETIQVAKDNPVVENVRSTRHGPILSDVQPKLQKLASKSPVDVPSEYAIALRWAALEPSKLMESVEELDKANNWQEFRAAATKFDVPAQNLVYADVDGNIGYQMPGKIPLRRQGDGRYPVPGWNDEHEWLGYINFEKLPESFNPESGYIVTANNPVVDENYPHVITKDWVYGYRAKSIEQMIVNLTQTISIADIQKIQGNTRNLHAQKLSPILLAIPFKDRHLESALQVLKQWNFQLEKDEPGAAIFEVFWKHLLADTFHDELPEAYFPTGGDRHMAVVSNLVEQPNHSWWDDKRTKEIERRDDIFKKAFTETITELENTFGKNPKTWNWGKLHQITFRNQTLGKSGIVPIEALFNRGSFSTSGNGESVNANRWKANKSYEATDIPSLRVIFDLANLNNSVAINSTGQSGHAYHVHYDDMIPLWLKVQYHQLHQESEDKLLLKPWEKV